MTEKCGICKRPKGRGFDECSAPDPNDYTPSLQCMGIALRKARNDLKAAEERGRRRGVEEAAEVCAEKARNYALRAAGQRAHGDLEEAQFLEPVATAVRDAEAAIRALAPRAQASDGPPCATCNHERFWHQWSSKEHAFCCSPVGSDYCGCKNYLAPRDSGPVCDCESPLWQGGHTPYCAKVQRRDSGKESK